MTIVGNLKFGTNGKVLQPTTKPCLSIDKPQNPKKKQFVEILVTTQFSTFASNWNNWSIVNSCVCVLGVEQKRVEAKVNLKWKKSGKVFHKFQKGFGNSKEIKQSDNGVCVCVWRCHNWIQTNSFGFQQKKRIHRFQLELNQTPNYFYNKQKKVYSHSST